MHLLYNYSAVIIVLYYDKIMTAGATQFTFHILRNSYKELLESRIISALRYIKLNQLQPTHFTEFDNTLRKKGIRVDVKYVPKEGLCRGYPVNYSTLKRIELGKTV